MLLVLYVIDKKKDILALKRSDLAKTSMQMIWVLNCYFVNLFTCFEWLVIFCDNRNHFFLGHLIENNEYVRLCIMHNIHYAFRLKLDATQNNWWTYFINFWKLEVMNSEPYELLFFRSDAFYQRYEWLLTYIRLCVRVLHRFKNRHQLVFLFYLVSFSE